MWLMYSTLVNKTDPNTLPCGTLNLINPSFAKKTIMETVFSIIKIAFKLC